MSPLKLPATPETPQILARKIARAAFNLHEADCEYRHILSQRGILIDLAINHEASVIVARCLVDPDDISDCY
jgi:hypothetical protein